MFVFFVQLVVKDFDECSFTEVSEEKQTTADITQQYRCSHFIHTAA